MNPGHFDIDLTAAKGCAECDATGIGYERCYCYECEYTDKHGGNYPCPECQGPLIERLEREWYEQEIKR